jgi:hypothetical protein
MKTAEEPARAVAEAQALPSQEPLPYSPEGADVPARDWDAQIEPPPAAARRVIKARLFHRGPSQPIVIPDPWQ